MGGSISHFVGIKIKAWATIPLALSSFLLGDRMDLVSETTPLLVSEDVLDEEAAVIHISPARKKGFPEAQQVAALMLITTVWPFSFEMIYPFINQVRSPVLRSPQGYPNIGAEVVYH